MGVGCQQKPIKKPIKVNPPTKKRDDWQIKPARHQGLWWQSFPLVRG